MKRFLLGFFCLLSLFASPLRASSYQDINGRIVIEAEDFTFRTRVNDSVSWVSRNVIEGFQGPGYVETFGSGEQLPYESSAGLSYRLKVNEEGSYYVWMRVYKSDGSSNSAYVGVDDRQIIDFDNASSAYRRWVWIREGILGLTQGFHVLNLHRRERGYKVDCILLTTDGSLTEESLNKNGVWVPTYFDDTPPGRISDLSVVSTEANQVKLSWTAPGDDGDKGMACSYQVRYAPLDAQSFQWDSAFHPVALPKPLAAGKKQSFVLSGIEPGSSYGFALKTLDAKGNVSGLSNVARIDLPDGDSSMAFVAEDGLLCFEAEHYNAYEPHGDLIHWRRSYSFIHYVGACYMDTPGSGEIIDCDEASALAYPISLSEKARYDVWLRVSCMDGSRNSAYMVVDDSEVMIVDDTSERDVVWTWTKAGSIDLDAGRHCIELRRREKGYRVDRIVLTSRDAYKPAEINEGMGPWESIFK